LVLVSTIPATMNATGFCWQHGRFLSESEVVRAFADDAARNLKMSPQAWQTILRVKTGDSNLIVTKVTDYRNGEELLLYNPTCCSVGKYSNGVADPLPNPRLWLKISGHAFQVVTSIIYFDERQVEHRFPLANHVWVDACGRIKRFRD
jgi:hypothetical protein